MGLNKFKLNLVTVACLFPFATFAYAQEKIRSDGLAMITVNPTSVQISYGATAQEITLLFHIVSNLPSKNQALSNIQLVPATPNTQITVKGYTITGDPSLTLCQNNILPPQGSTGYCDIHLTIQAQGAQTIGQQIGPYNYTFSLKYGARQTPLTSIFPISFADGTALSAANRTITFVNNCNYPVWLGLASGATNSITPDPAQNPANPTSCLTNSDCYPGSSCVFVHAATRTTPALSQCYWSNPTPNDQPANFKLDALTGPDAGPRTTTTVTIPAFNNGIDTIWTGGAIARTGCSGSAGGANSCQTGNCCVGAVCGNTGACAEGSGFLTPASKAEFTFLNQIPVVYSNTPNSNTDADSYDITLVDGITVPTSMGPNNAAWGGSTQPYTCGTPGGAADQSPLGACSWEFTPVASSTPSPIVTNIYPADYVWLDTTGFTAQTDCDSGGSSCATGTCGVALVDGTTLTVGCGTQLGYWTADSLCGKDPNGVTPVGSNFNCGAEVQGLLLLTDLYGCALGQLNQSCYTTPVNTCCGCVNWSSISGVSVPPAPITTNCPATNTNWTTYGLNTVEWLKKGCPTAYSYPYDDASSTFTCNTLNSNHQNVTNYTITFCPLIPL